MWLLEQGVKHILTGLWMHRYASNTIFLLVVRNNEIRDILNPCRIQGITVEKRNLMCRSRSFLHCGETLCLVLSCNSAMTIKSRWVLPVAVPRVTWPWIFHHRVIIFSIHVLNFNSSPPTSLHSGTQRGWRLLHSLKVKRTSPASSHGSTLSDIITRHKFAAEVN